VPARAPTTFLVAHRLAGTLPPPYIYRAMHAFLQAGLSVARNRVIGPSSTLAMSRALGDTK
jgi:hypothetical protein